LLHDFEAEYASVLDYLGISLSPDKIRQVKESTRFETMKKRNPHHLRKGESGGWINVLTAAQARQVARIAGPMLDLLGYPIEIADPSNRVFPGMPARLDRNQIREAIAAARGGIPDKLRFAYAFAASRRSFREKLAKGLEFLGGKGRWDPKP
jgi:aryl sulfotransferase